MMRGFSPCAIAIRPSSLHLVHVASRLHRLLELVGHRQKEQVRHADAVYRCSERRGDAVAELGRIVQILHHGHQAEHRADDAERRRIHAHALEYLRGAQVRRLARVHVELEGAADGVGLAAVDHQLQPLAQEHIRLAFEQRLEPEQPLPARDVAPVDDLPDQPCRLVDRWPQYPRKQRQCPLHHVHRRLHADGRDRADHHDHEGGSRYQRVHPGALEYGAHDDRNGGEQQAGDAEDVHQPDPSCATRSAAPSGAAAPVRAAGTRAIR